MVEVHNSGGRVVPREFSPQCSDVLVRPDGIHPTSQGDCVLPDGAGLLDPVVLCIRGGEEREVERAAPDVRVVHVQRTQRETPRSGWLTQFLEAMPEFGVVDSAREILGATGSRSRDPDYLARIEHVVADRPSLVHYRVLHGPPRGGALKNHLLRLVDLQREEGSVNIGVMWDLYKDPERFICASEREAVVVLPSITSTSNYDTALVISRSDLARAYVDHVRQAFLASDALASRAMVEKLEVLR